MTKQNHRMRRAGTAPVPDRVRTFPTLGGAEKVSTDVHLSNRSALAEMSPGDILFLDEASELRESSSPDFIAILACPWCGAPGLITAAQFSGAGSIVCTSKNCSGLFRIVNEAQIVPIPPI